MNIGVFALTYGPRTTKLIEDNLSRAGMPYVVHFINRQGIAHALNEAIDITREKGYDAMMTMANDIREPNNWLLERSMHLFPDAGIIGISLEGPKHPTNMFHGMAVCVGDVIGNMLINRTLIDKIGYFNTFNGRPYAPVDNDYNVRASAAGFINLYVPGMEAIHVNTGDNDIYGYSKRAAIEALWPLHEQNAGKYLTGELSYTIFEKQWQGEDQRT